MRIAIGSDHAGFALKEAVKVFLDPRSMATSDYAEAVGQALRDKRAARGILLCGSGVGASMAVQLAVDTSAA
jgi:ribose 5-phosphate isomerase RpiB